ncbi:hypothetical protein [Actinoplanes sp. NPDC049599]
MLFLAVVADPGRQFEFVQTEGSVALRDASILQSANPTEPGRV